MIGHEPTLSQTNTRGWVVVCQCGWISNVAPMVASSMEELTSRHYRSEAAKDNALAMHMHHCEHEREEIAAASARALDAHAGFIRVAGPTVRRVGRWGSG